MLKKTITYKDLDGNEVTDEFYFGLSKPELVKLEISQEGGLSDYLTKIVKSKDSEEILAFFEKIIAMSVGKRSEDGKSLLKSEAISQAFLNSDAWTVMFDEMLEHGGARGADLVKHIMPAELSSQIDNLPPLPEAENETEDADVMTYPTWVMEGRVPTPAELKGATQEQLQEAFRRQAANRE